MPPTRKHFAIAALFLLTLTAYGSIIPLEYKYVPFSVAMERIQHMRWFEGQPGQVRADWTVNSLQFATLSFFCMGFLAVDRRRSLALLLAVFEIVALCICAYWLEVLQVYFPPRTISANDVAVECLGSVLGAIGWLAFGSMVTNWARRFWDQRGLVGLANQLLPGYVFALFVVNAMPFDFVHGFSELRNKISSGRVQFIPFVSFGSEGFLTSMISILLNFVAYLPLGILLGIVPRWANRRLNFTTWTGLGIAIGIELTQLVMTSRHFKLIDILMGTLAVTLAARWIRAFDGPLQRGYAILPQGIDVRFRRLQDKIASWGLAQWIGLLVVWAVVVLALSWQPYNFQFHAKSFLRSDPDLSDENTPVIGLRRMSFMPFVDYYRGSRYSALDQFLRRGISFLPLGIIGAIIFSRRPTFGLFATLGAAIVFGTLIEVGQYFIPERHPGLTDLGIHVAGTWFGFGLILHLRKVIGP